MFEYLRRNAKSKDNFPLGRMIEAQEEGARQSKPWTLKEVAGKTVWDWFQFGLQIFSTLVVVLIAIGGWRVAANLDDRQRALTMRQATTQLAVEDQRAQDLALQSYLDQMSTLVLEHNLRESKQNSEIRILAKARTGTVMQTLDAEDNRTIIRFLEAERLTGNLYGERPAAISLLSGADLQGARLKGLDLSNVNLSNTILDHADLRSSMAVWMVEASLFKADMRYIYLEDANLNDANMEEADLREAHLDVVNMMGASLRGANLRGVNLMGAFLKDTDLSNADLTNAKITQEQIEMVESLDGATMRNGQTYEEWVKDKKSNDEADLKNRKAGDAYISRAQARNIQAGYE